MNLGHVGYSHVNWGPGRLVARRKNAALIGLKLVEFAPITNLSQKKNVEYIVSNEAFYL